MSHHSDYLYTLVCLISFAALPGYLCKDYVLILTCNAYLVPCICELWLGGRGPEKKCSDQHLVTQNTIRHHPLSTY